MPAFAGLTGVLCSLKRCTTQLKIPGLNLTAILAARNVKERVAVALCVAALSFAVVSGLRYAGGLERIELPVHDRIIESRGGRPAHPDVVVILETEADLQRFGHPLSDGKLAELLQRLKNLNPALMAVDKYRDLPVAPGSAALDKFLTETPNIFWVAKYGAAAFDGVRPPKVLDGSEQVACADIVVDADLRVRRTLVALGEGDKVCPGLAYALAASWLSAKGHKAGFDPAHPHALLLGNAALPLSMPWDGPYAGEDMAGYQLPVAYLRAPPPSFTLADLADGKIPADALKGKIVLLGSSATSLRDFFDVPKRKAIADTNQPGVTVHAYAVVELLDAAAGSAPPVGVSVTSTHIAMAGMALFGAFLFVTSLPISAAAGFAILIVLAWLPLSWLLVALPATHGWVLAPIAPMLAGLVAATTSAGFRAWREARDRQELMGWFSKHVSREVAEAIWEGRNEFTANGRIPPRSVFVSVLFADIRSYTTITEKLPIPVMVAWLNRAISAMTSAVMENGGVVTKFAGDQVMAVFGVPIPRVVGGDLSSDAAHTIDAGLDIGRRLAALNEEFAKENLPAVRVRVGIYSGEVVQAGLGSEDRFEFTVLGDVVNIASRLESYTTEDDGATARVLIGESTRSLVEGNFRIEPLGEIPLKGKTVMINVFRVFERMKNKETS